MATLLINGYGSKWWTPNTVAWKTWNTLCWTDMVMENQEKNTYSNGKYLQLLPNLLGSKLILSWLVLPTIFFKIFDTSPEYTKIAMDKSAIFLQWSNFSGFFKTSDIRGAMSIRRPVEASPYLFQLLLQVFGSHASHLSESGTMGFLDPWLSREMDFPSWFFCGYEAILFVSLTWSCIQIASKIEPISISHEKIIDSNTPLGKGMC